jgi:beta-lactamase regulating signal transducer with metallopeptidase domain
MIQHLLNTTAIWLLSLVLFDIFLRKETYHTYNRLYLLFTFFAGLLLPLWRWTDPAVIEAAGMATPAARTEAFNQAIVEAGTKATTIDWQQWCLIVYLAGAVISAFLLCRDALIIASYYRQGQKSKDGVWTIIETNKEHSPFSAFRYIFVSKRNHYTADQFRIILTHEEHHGRALHFIDLLIMQLGKVALWFHPLVYLYNLRLLMVHEYQADAAVEKQPAEYGQFLVEQSLLGTAPALSHSFNRSPIKNRIMMLTRKTSAMAKGKQLIMAPLLLVCFIFFTQKAFSDDKRKEGNKVHYKGNVFELWGPATNDTVMVEDPVTGEWILKIARADSFPTKMNGEYIYREDELSRPEREQVTKTRLAIQEFIVDKMQPAFEQLGDGVYIMNARNVIVNKEGKIVYHERPFFMSNDRPSGLTEKQTTEIVGRFNLLLASSDKFDPIMRAGNPVAFNIESLFDLKNLIIIRDHKFRK